MEYVIAVALLLVGFGLGISVTRFLTQKDAVGTLCVAYDSDEPYLFLKLKADPRKLVHNDLVTLQVDVKKPGSQK